VNLAYALRDLNKQKTRTVFGISGIAIAIFLLAVIGMLGDSISYSYVEYASQSEGNIDFEINGGDIPTNLVQNRIMGDPVLASVLHDFLPRNEYWGSPYEIISTRNVSKARLKTDGVVHVGVDIARENAALHSKFLLPDGTPFTGSLGSDECLINKEMAKDLGVNAGDQIIYNRTVYWDVEKTQFRFEDLRYYTVKAVVDFNFKFPSWIENAVVMNLSQWITEEWWGYVGYSYSLIVNFANPQLYYDAKDIGGTINRVREVGERIQNRIGFYNNFTTPGGPQVNVLFNIHMPRVGILEIEQYVNVGISIILLFVTILAVVISAVLINGILTTSVEEKIREFGVFRVLGAHRELPIKLTVLQAFIVSSIGTSIGIGGGYAAVRFGLLPLLKEALGFAGNVVAYMSVQTISITLGVGIGVSMLVGIAPALRVSKMSILGAINPYRQESVGTRMVKEGNINGRLILVGAIASGIAAFVLFIVPQILLTLDIGLIVGVIIALLAVFLLGATLVGLGLLPVIQGIIMRIFTFFARKTKDIIRISLMRYSRRNVTTVIMFSIAFSFITLVSTVIGTLSAQNIGQVRNRNGADMVIDSRRQFIGHFNPEGTPSIPDISFSNELLSYDAVVKTSTILPTDMELGIIRGSAHSIKMADLVNYKSSDVNGVAIDENYLEVVYTEYIVFSQGSQADAFNKVLHGTRNVIVSTALSGNLMLNLNDKCSLRFEWGNGEIHEEQFTIVGVVDNLPGIPTVQKRPDSASGAAIVLSQADYRRCFQIPAGNYYTSRIFVKIRADMQNYENSVKFETFIEERYDSLYRFESSSGQGGGGYPRVINSYRQGRMQQTIFMVIEALFTLILTFAVIISLFGLTSSAYSTILERTREVGIIETLGLHKRSVGNMFTLESEIIMSSAAINGSVIGIILVALFFWQIAAFQSFPVMSVFDIPYDIIGIELGVAALVCLISMKGLVKKVQRQEIMEIFRKTM